MFGWIEKFLFQWYLQLRWQHSASVSSRVTKRTAAMITFDVCPVLNNSIQHQQRRVCMLHNVESSTRGNHLQQWQPLAWIQLISMYMFTSPAGASKHVNLGEWRGNANSSLSAALQQAVSRWWWKLEVTRRDEACILRRMQWWIPMFTSGTSWSLAN